MQLNKLTKTSLLLKITLNAIVFLSMTLSKAQSLPNYALLRSLNGGAAGNKYGGGMAKYNNNLYVGSTNYLSKGAVIPFDISKEQLNQGTIIPAPTTVANGAEFGKSIAVYDKWMIVGAHNDVRSGSAKTGSAFIYENVSGTWTLRNTIVDLHTGQPTKGSNFLGFSVAMNSTYAFVGIPYDDSIGTGPNYSVNNNCGAVIVFKRNGSSWTRIAKWAGPDGLASLYGWSITCSENELFIAADAANSSAGRVHRYSLIGGNWIYQNYIDPPVSGAFFGSKMQLNGKYLFVGGPSFFPSNGAVYVYFDSLSNGNWKLKQTINPQVPRQGGFFGSYALDVYGDVAAIGEMESTNFKGQLNYYKRINGTWVYQKNYQETSVANNNYNGHAASVSGNYIFSGSYLSDAGGVDAGEVFWYKSPEIIASRNKTDGYIDLEWRLSTEAALTSPPTEIYFQILDSAKQQEIYSEKFDDVSNLPFIAGSFRHYVKPNANITYQARIFQYGTGTLLSGPFSTVGSTKPQILPYFTNSSPSKSLLEKIELNFNSNSTYYDKIQIYKNNQKIAIVDSSEKIFFDNVELNNSSAIENGKKYTYCLKSMRTGTTDTAYSVCDTGATVPVNFTASDNATDGVVTLNWNYLGAFADYFIIERNGIRIKSLPFNSVSYKDETAIPGQENSYTFIVISKQVEVLRQADKGSAVANGVIEGYVFNKTGGYGLSGVSVALSASVNNTLVTQNTTTDARGYYKFSKVFYGSSSDFKIKVSKSGIAFTETEKSTTLSLDFPKQNLNFESVITATVQDLPSTIVVNSFVVKPDSTRDLVSLNMDFSATTDVQVYLKRNELVSNSYFLKSSDVKPTLFEDLTGIPNDEYNYTFEIIQVSGTKVYKKVLEEKIIFPSVAPILDGNAAAVANVTDGTADMNWSHTSKNYNGVVVYLNDKKIGEYFPSDLSIGQWIEKLGANNVNQNYVLKTFRICEDRNRYESKGLNKSITYPALKPISGAALETTTEGYYKLNWTYLFDSNSYNYTGVKIVRRQNTNYDTLATVPITGPSYFIDKTATLNSTNISYQVIVYKSPVSLSTTVEVTPSSQLFLDTVRSLSVTNTGYIDGVVRVFWNYLSNKTIDGFRIVVGTDTIWKKSDEFSLFYGFKDNYTNASQKFEIWTFREIDNVKYFSKPKSRNGNCTAFPGGTLPAVTNLTATQNLPDKITLNWNYPNYYLPLFGIYRDGILISSVSNDARIFSDYVGDGRTHTYSVVPAMVSPSNRARSVSVVGKRAMGLRVFGIARNIKSGNGIANTKVYVEEARSGLSTMRYFPVGVAKTDSNGTFSIENIPMYYNGFYRVSIDAQSNLISNNNQEIVYYNQNQEYIEFTDTMVQNLAPSDQISKPVRLKAVVNSTNNSIELNWSSDGPNYSGFEVYRGLNLIQKIPVGMPLIYADLEGAPGFSYTYRIKTYWENEPGNILKSDFAVVNIDYPKLAPITNFKATPNLDFLQLTWDHISDKHSYYEILRNGMLLAEVKTGNPMLYNDTSGSSGISYLYQISAVSIKNSKFESVKTNLNIVYPEKNKAQNLSLTLDSNKITLNWNPISGFNNFYSVYRDGVFLNKIAAKTTANSYTDFTGIPNQKYRYEVRAGYVRNANQFESKPIYVDGVFPKFSLPRSVIATPIASSDAVSVKWSYGYSGATNFKIYRSESTGPVSLIATVPATIFTYTDFSGAPNKQYFYYVSATDIRTNLLYESGLVKSNFVAFPALSQPINPVATINSLNVVTTTWDYNNTDTSISFEIHEDFTKWSTAGFYNQFFGCSYNLAGTQSIYSLDAKIQGSYRRHQKINHVGNNIRGVGNGLNSGTSPNICYGYDDNYNNFTIRTVKNINGVKYYSAYVAVSLSPGSPSRLSGSSITSFTASDGVYNNKVYMQWTIASTSGVKAFNIYRDGLLIESVDPSQSNYFDENPVPGKVHVYSILVDYNSGGTGTIRAVSDFGNSIPTGVISGGVVTYNNGIGIPGVKITAEATIENNFYQYTAVTDADGKYEIPKVYFGEKTKYKVTAAFANHVFDVAVQFVTLETDIYRATVPDFRDKTAFVLKGNISYNQGCGLDSLTIKLISKYKNGTPIKTEEALTNLNGNYSFSINPYDPDLESLELVLKDTQTASGFNAKTRYHKFNLKSVKYTNFSNWPLEKTQNFTDNLVFPINLNVRNSCGQIGAYQFYVKIKSENGCIEKTVLTDNTGKLTLNLPPYDYKFTVSSATPLDANIAAVMDYFTVRPVTLNLSEMLENGADLKIIQNKFTPIDLNFVFHKTPKISITNTISYLCNNPNNPIFLKQSDTARMQLAVRETHGTKTCNVDNGFIVVRNNASEVTEDTIRLIEGRRAFELFTFKVGAPIVVEPYTKDLIFEYHTESDGFLCEKINACAIDGVAQQQGTDIIIDKRDGQDFQIPLMVLRDPPGDESYSYIEKGTTFKRTLKMSDKNSGYGGIRGENKFNILGNGLSFETEIKSAGGSGRSAEFELSVTTKQRVQTPAANSVINADNTNFLLGSDGDVIVGTGVAMAYGIGERIAIDNNTCQITKTSIVTLAPEKVNTTWVYTVDHIKKLIKDYKNDSINLESNLYQIAGQTKEQTRQDLHTRILNWESVLQFHFYDNVPFVQLCNPSNYANIDETQKSNVMIWVKQGFCKDAGTYISVNGVEKFVPKKDLKFTQDLLDKYNATSQAVGRLINQEFEFNDNLIYSEAALKNWKIEEGAKLFYGVEAENLTFSGNTNYEKSVTVASSKSRSYEQHWSFDFDNFFGVINKQTVTVVTVAGIGVMVGAQKDVVDLEIENGLIFGYNHEFERSESNATITQNTTGFVLTDNDAGDQFSVTVIRGNDPLNTPYFLMLGGRSSCPPEPGTILRDQPFIQLQDEFGNFANPVQYDLDPNKTVTLPVKFSNLAPQLFNDQHYFTLAPLQNKNRFGARLYLTGDRLGKSEFLIPSGSSVYANLEIERAEKFYDYDDIVISLAASCPNLETPDNYFASDKEIQLHFRHPCSDVSILSPGDNWTLRKATNQSADPDEKLIVKIADFDVENPLLEKITLQYRRIGSDIWSDIETITRDSLKNYYTQNKITYPVPVYPFVWNIKGNAAIVDGDYELRAQSRCGKGGVIFSNVIKGKIDRTTVVLFGQPQPADGLLSLGDEISITFNKNILCGLTSANYSFKNAITNAPIAANVTCLGNKLVFTFLDPISSLDETLIKATVTGIKDLNENAQSAAIEWTFKVSNNPVFWAPEIINYEMYQGKNADLKASLINTFLASQNYSLTLKNGTWLSTSTSTGIVLPSGKEINFTINSVGLQPGKYFDTVIANIAGYSLLRLPINLTVYPKPVNWNLDPSKFSSSATVICNYTLDSTEILSSDTLDKIGAFIGGELRGVANIIKAGNYYRAYLNIFGNITDADKPVEFNVWHARNGVEYAAHMRGAIKFKINGFYGTTISPRVLDVSTVLDSIRYVPLKAGWNYLAFNTTQNSNSVNTLLSRLKSSDGDMIKTLNKTSYYDATSGEWINTSAGLQNISTNEGYMIYLAKADTLKLFGKNAQLEGSYDLKNGWNLIGNPYQKDKAINEAFSGIEFSNLAKIKNDNQAADYDSASKKWNGILNLQMNKSYMLKNGKESSMIYNRGEDLDCQQLRNANFEFNATFLAGIKINGLEQLNATDKVVAFSGNECRGQGQLEFIPSLNKYALNMFVYSNTLGEKITFKIFNNATGMWYDVADTLSFKSNNQYGSPAQLWMFSNRNDVNNSTKSIKANLINALAYPNPFNNEIQLKIESKSNQKMTVEIVDMQGRNLFATDIKVAQGMNTHRINLSKIKLSEGIYLIMVSDGVNIPYSVRMVKSGSN